MGFLSGFISPGLTAASKAVAGHQEGEITAAIEARELKRQEEQDKLRAILQGMQTKNLSSEIFTREHPKPTYDSDRGVMVDGASATATPVAGVTPKDPVKNAVAVAEATKGIPTYSDLHPKEHFTFTPGIDPTTGKPTVYSGDTSTGKISSTGVERPVAGAGGGNLPAPLAAKVGQFGEMLKKASDLMPAMETLNVSLNNSAAQDVATHGIGAFGMHIPGTQGAGSMMVNHSPEYATYQAAVSPFVLAAAHALSGARINDTQVQQIRASIEIKPGESPQAREQKRKNLIDLINSIGGSLPPDAIGAQEDQMDANAMTLLKGHGYKNAVRKNTPPPSQAPSHTGASDPGGDIHLGKPSHAQALWDAAVAKYGEAVVTQKFGPRPEQ